VPLRDVTEQSKAKQRDSPGSRCGGGKVPCPHPVLLCQSCPRRPPHAKPAKVPQTCQDAGRVTSLNCHGDFEDVEGECGAIHQQTDNIIAARIAQRNERKQGHPPTGLPSCPSQPAPRPSPHPQRCLCLSSRAFVSRSPSPLCHLFQGRKSWDTFFSGLAGGKKSVGLRRKVTPFETRPAQSPTAQSDIRQWVTDCLFGLRARVPIRR